MTDPYIAEIRILPYNFQPRDWAWCNGQLLSIAQNTALFSLIGDTYGGDGRNTMALPNLQGRAPVHVGRGPGLTDRRLGEPIGEDSVTLTEAQMPAHAHEVRVAQVDANLTTPQGHYLADASVVVRGRAGPQNMYTSAQNANGQMSPQAIGTTGGNQAHENRQPFLAINFCISLYGTYPSRN